MGLIDKLGKAAKDVTKGVIKTGVAIKKGIDDNIEIQRKKRILLNKFTMSDLKKICDEYGIGQPSSYDEDFLTGEREKITLTRDDYIEYIEKKLNLDHVEDYCKKHRMNIPDSPREEKQSMPQIKPVEPIHGVVSPQPQESKTEIRSEPIAEVPTPQPPKANEFDLILQTIKEKFEPEDSRDEKEFEKQLTQILKLLYPNRIQRQVPTPKGRIDIVIDDKYGLELKIADSSGKLRALKGQVHDYKKVLDEVAVVLLDVHKLSASDMREFVQDCEELGVKTIILEGQFKPRKGRGTDIHLRMNR